MRVEFRNITPPPPVREVIISLSVEDAVALHNELYSITRHPEPHYTVNRLLNTLTDARIQRLLEK